MLKAANDEPFDIDTAIVTLRLMGFEPFYNFDDNVYIRGKSETIIIKQNYLLYYHSSKHIHDVRISTYEELVKYFK